MLCRILRNVGVSGIAAVHQPRDVGEADFAGGELFVIEHAQAARARRLVAVEREVDFLDAEALGARAERLFSAERAAAEEDFVFALQHRRSLFVVAFVGVVDVRRLADGLGRVGVVGASTSGSSCFMKSGVMSIASSSSVSSRSNVRPVNFVGIGPRGLSSFFLNGFFLSFGGAGGPKSFWRAPPGAGAAAAGVAAARRRSRRDAGRRSRRHRRCIRRRRR